MAKQIILTQNNFGIPIELQFVSNTNSPIDLTDKIVEVAISYDGTIIDVKLHHVVLVSEKSFRNCPGIRSIVFPATVKEFQKNIFTSYNYNLRVIKLLGKKVPKMEKTSFRGVPKKCKMYVKTKTMKRAVRNAGFRGKIIVKK